jgi:hypothetical protein
MPHARRPISSRKSQIRASERHPTVTPSHRLLRKGDLALTARSGSERSRRRNVGRCRRYHDPSGRIARPRDRWPSARAWALKSPPSDVDARSDGLPFITCGGGAAAVVHERWSGRSSTGPRAARAGGRRGAGRPRGTALEAGAAAGAQRPPGERRPRSAGRGRTELSTIDRGRRRGWGWGEGNGGRRWGGSATESSRREDGRRGARRCRGKRQSGTVRTEHRGRRGVGPAGDRLGIPGGCAVLVEVPR